MRVWKGLVGLAVLMLTIGGTAMGVATGVAWADDTNSNNSNNMGGGDQSVGTDQNQTPSGEASPAGDFPLAAH